MLVRLWHRFTWTLKWLVSLTGSVLWFYVKVNCPQFTSICVHNMMISLVILFLEVSLICLCLISVIIENNSLSMLDLSARMVFYMFRKLWCWNVHDSGWRRKINRIPIDFTIWFEQPATSDKIMLLQNIYLSFSSGNLLLLLMFEPSCLIIWYIHLLWYYYAVSMALVNGFICLYWVLPMMWSKYLLLLMGVPIWWS